MTTLSVNLSSQLQTELTWKGVWAYAVMCYKGQTDLSSSNWTTLVADGVVQGGGTDNITLPLPFDGGKVYFIIQSQDPSAPTNLTTALATQSMINLDNAAKYDFAYDSIEATLKGDSYDVANLTSVNAFAIPMELSVPGKGSLGYAVPGAEVVTDIQAINRSNIYTANYTAGPLKDHFQDYFRMAIGPSTASASSPFLPADWNGYLQSLEGPQANDIEISGVFVGAKDANEVYHNGGYFAYQLDWDGQDFWLVPMASSQIKGDIKLTVQDLENSIYSTLGKMSVYANQNPDTQPFLFDNILFDNTVDGDKATSSETTGWNDQWGAVMSNFLTGFTAGYYGTQGKPFNPRIEASSTVNLDRNINWDPNYAFGQNLATPAPAYQPYDPYSAIFYHTSNSYGSGYADNLMKTYPVGGPLISTWNGTADVANINVTLFAPREQPAGYTKPVMYDYLAAPEGTYLVPTLQASPPNIGLNFAAGAANEPGVVLPATASIALNILTGDTGGIPTFTPVTFDGSSTPGGLWQIWRLDYDTTTQAYIARAIGSSNLGGYMVITNLPTATNGVSWYQISVGSKTYNLYTTTDASGLFVNPKNQAGALQIDGTATIATGPATALNTFSINLGAGTNVTYDPSLVVTKPAPTAAPVDAPVAGTLSGPTFTPLAGQTNPNANTITTASASVAFAWTGENKASPDWASWISAATNKLEPLDVARVAITSSTGSTRYASATANLDGEWQTNLVQLTPGTYTVTMQEFLASDTTFQTPLTPASHALTLTETGTGTAQRSDFNGDGTSDILWANNSNGQVFEWLMNNGVNAQAAGLLDDPSWQVVGSGDFNDDGTSDILWRQPATGGVVEWQMNNGAIANNGWLLDDPSFTVAGTGDFNGDGTTDILWRQASTGAVYEWDMNGLINTASIGLLQDPSWTVVGTGDFNDDGTSDILWRQASTGAVYEWQMNNGTPQNSIGLLQDPSWTVAGTGDFNGDGTTDILWRQASTGAVYEWQMNQGMVANSIGLLADPSWNVVGVGDYNGDGRSDILWNNDTTGQTYEWQMNSSGGLAASVGLLADTAWTPATALLTSHG